MSVADCEPGLCRCRGTCDCAREFGGIAADEFRVAIDDHLRRVDRVEAEVLRVVLLARIDRVEGKRIAPAEMVPVSDVLAENDGLGAGNKLLLVVLGQKSDG